jgi:hypothetical protein
MPFLADFPDDIDYVLGLALTPRDLGWLEVEACRSTTHTRNPCCAGNIDAAKPTRPPPTTRTSQSHASAVNSDIV